MLIFNMSNHLYTIHKALSYTLTCILFGFVMQTNITAEHISLRSFLLLMNTGYVFFKIWIPITNFELVQTRIKLTPI